MQASYDLLIIGAGPGGYVAAIRAAQLGLNVALVEKDKPGGVCLNMGCIPSKALIHQSDLVRGAKDLAKLGAKVDLSGLDYGLAFKKSREAAERLSKGVRFLLKKNKVDYIQGEARLEDATRVHVSGTGVLEARSVILATGSRPRALPGLDFDERRVLSSDGGLMLQSLPKRMAVIGGGPIGLELAQVWASFGSQVTVIEVQDRIAPLEDPEVSQVLEKAYRAQGLAIHTATLASPANLDELKADGAAPLRLALRPAAKAAPASPGAQGPAAGGAGPAAEGGELVVDAVLVAVGRSPNSGGLGLEKVGVRLNRGFVEVGDYCQTAAAGVYAIGDLTQTPALAHVASKEGELAVAHIAHRLKGLPLPRERRVDPSLVPSAIYTHPEAASFGLKPDQAQSAGRAAKSFSFPFQGVGRAVASEATTGFVKITADEKTGELLGASIVGEQASELLHELLLAKAAELTFDDIAELMHAHPTLSEGVMEAARGLSGWAIHI